jgi:hypothetical protein
MNIQQLEGEDRDEYYERCYKIALVELSKARELWGIIRVQVLNEYNKSLLRDFEKMDELLSGTTTNKGVNR